MKKIYKIYVDYHIPFMYDDIEAENEEQAIEKAKEMANEEYGNNSGFDIDVSTEVADGKEVAK